MKSKQSRMSVGKKLLFAVKLIITIILISWIVVYIDWHLFWSNLTRIDPNIILVVVALRFFGIAISTYKWQQLLAVHGLHYQFGQLHRWYLVGMFFSTFLPTSIGGDGYRIYKTLDNPKAKSCAVLPVVVERVTGLFALLLLGYFAALYIYFRDADTVAHAIVIGGTICISGGATLLYLAFRLQLLERFSRLRYCPKQLVTLISFLNDFRQHPRKVSWALAISFLFHANQIFGTWLIFYSLGVIVDPSHLTIAVMAGAVIGLLPISLGGLGLIEVSFIYVMGHFGLNAESVLTTMLLSRGLMIPIILLGARFYYFQDGVRSKNNTSISEFAEK